MDEKAKTSDKPSKPKKDNQSVKIDENVASKEINKDLNEKNSKSAKKGKESAKD